MKLHYFCTACTTLLTAANMVYSFYAAANHDLSWIFTFPYGCFWFKAAIMDWRYIRRSRRAKA